MTSTAIETLIQEHQRNLKALTAQIPSAQRTLAKATLDGSKRDLDVVQALRVEIRRTEDAIAGLDQLQVAEQRDAIVREIAHLKLELEPADAEVRKRDEAVAEARAGGVEVWEARRDAAAAYHTAAAARDVISSRMIELGQQLVELENQHPHLACSRGEV